MINRRGENYKERKNAYRLYTNKKGESKYPGVYHAWVPSPATGKGEEVFYISYYAHGVRRFEKVVSPDAKPLTAARANQIRADRMRDKELSNTERRQQERAK